MHQEYCTTTYSPPRRAWTVPPGDPALAAWLAPRAEQPWYGATIWRLYLQERAQAAELLGVLEANAVSYSAVGVFETRGLYLYLWLKESVQIKDLLRSYDASLSTVTADQIQGGWCWACGRALLRLLGAGPTMEVGHAESL